MSRIPSLSASGPSDHARRGGKDAGHPSQFASSPRDHELETTSACTRRFLPQAGESATLRWCERCFWMSA